ICEFCGYIHVEAADISLLFYNVFFFSSRRRHTRSTREWSSDVCSSDLHPLSIDRCTNVNRQRMARPRCALRVADDELLENDVGRSEERRVGKECRSRWSV